MSAGSLQQRRNSKAGLRIADLHTLQMQITEPIPYLIRLVPQRRRAARLRGALSELF